MNLRILFVIALLAVGAQHDAAIAADSHIDVSHIVDQTTAESILGEPVKSATPRNVDGKDGYYSKCNYYTSKPGKALVVRVYQAAPGTDPQTALEAVTESTGAMTTVPGLGDRARLSSGAEGGLPLHVVMLYVVKGNALVTVGLSGLDDDVLAAEKTKTVAQKVLASL
ncbi:MAG TPA: hypothetical protein VFO30_00135 [Chthoniobacterales bacterium]|nr:hypothetical protein [Chthoniobacterales bacterium]